MSAKTKVATITLPRGFVEVWEAVREGSDSIEADVLEQMVLSLVRRHKITASRGAELLSLCYQDFLSLMDRNEIPILDYSPEELDQEIKDLNTVLGERP